MSDQQATLDYLQRGPKRPQFPLTPDECRWRSRRIWLRVGLWILVFPIAWYFGPNLLILHQFTRPSPADFIPRARQAIPTVLAIKEYQRVHGALPACISDLGVKWRDDPNEHYEMDQNRMWSDPWGRFFPHQIMYDFTPGNEHWEVHGPYTNGRIPLPLVTLGVTTQPLK